MRFHNLTIFIMCLHEGDVPPMFPCMAQICVWPEKKRIALFCNLSDCSHFLFFQIPAK